VDVALGSGGRADLPPEELPDAPDGYDSLTRIDQGGSAVVYRAFDTRFERTVALKILHSDSLDERQQRRFDAECLAIGRVSSHPNIVTVYDAGTTRGRRPWLAMEYCSGGSLAHKVARQGPLPVPEVISIGVRLCGALAAAHQAGILHRDVKPHNVLLTSYGEPALADFGIASVRSLDGGTDLTATETAAYTVVHAAPEILEGKSGTASADLYSLGSTLYTLLAGQAPFAKEASTGLAPLVTRILRNDLPVIPRPGVPPELERLLRRTMAAHPADRPTSAAELGTSLADLASLGVRLSADQGTPQPPLSRPAAEPSTAEPSTAEPSTAEPSAHSPHSAAEPPISARRLLATLCGVLGILLAVFLALGPGFNGSAADRSAPKAASKPAPSEQTQRADKYAPGDLSVTQGRHRGDLIVTWRMPIRPDVVATVIYDGAGAARARAIVSYNSSPRGSPQATLHGLASSRRVCLSATNVVSIADRITNAASRPVCAVPR